MTARVDDNSQNRPGRRKACDLCFTKKIKCDMLQPTCSNCVLYKAECTAGKGRRKTNPSAKVRAATTAAAAVMQQQTARTSADQTEDRLARIEKQLEQLISLQMSRPPDAPHAGSWSHTNSSPGDQEDSAVVLSHFNSDVTVALRGPMPFDSAKFPWNGDVVMPRDELPLPPLADIMPIVDHYFDRFAPIVPLFDQQSFMHLLNQWYAEPSTRNKASWAAIQVVLALALRTPTVDANGKIDTNAHANVNTTANAHAHTYMSGRHGATDRHHRANFFLRNAQSVVSDLVTRDQDLLGLQVLLGIVILFQSSSDNRPASVIIGTAMRLAHRMRLHSKEHARFFSPEENLHRQRLFWVAYILDKDISLRIKVPSVQADSDIDIDVGPRKPDDNIGVLLTTDGATYYNYHRSMIHLAQIQGKVYDWLHSNSASNISRHVRRQRVRQLDRMLSRWYATIPPPFRIDAVDRSVGEVELIHMTKMYHMYLLVLTMTHGIWSQDADWVRAIRSGDRNAIRSMALGGDFDTDFDSRDLAAPLMPGSWSNVVQVSRGCLRLFGECTPTDCLIWQCCCPQFSGMMVLLVNLLIEPTHPDASADELFSARAIQLFDKVVEFVPDPEHCVEVRDIIGDLHATVLALVNDARSSRGEAASVDLLQSNLLSYDLIDEDPWSWATALPERMTIFPDARNGFGVGVGVGGMGFVP